MIIYNDINTNKWIYTCETILENSSYTRYIVNVPYRANTKPGGPQVHADQQFILVHSATLWHAVGPKLVDPSVHCHRAVDCSATGLD